mgnify:CR=1 FL=1
MYQSILKFNRARYFWVALGLTALSIAAYWWHEPVGVANGGTWLGYTLGTIGALLIFWLMWLGIRKRSYTSNVGSVQGWTSAHVYLGTALLVVGTLHGGFQFGLNLHTLTYVLMVIVIVSGIFGIVVYLRYPSLMSLNRAGDTLDNLLEKINKIDDRSLSDASSSAGSAPLRKLVESAIEGCHLGGSSWQQLRAIDASRVVVPVELGEGAVATEQSNKDQALVINTLANRLSQLSGGPEAGLTQGLLFNFSTKQTLLRRIRRDTQVRALLKIWLYVHVPLSFALLAALISHIIVVFFYW